MSTLKVEWVFPATNLYHEDQLFVPQDKCVPVVRLEALREWLRAHQYPRQYGATVHNGVIDDLLEELKDLA